MTFAKHVLLLSLFAVTQIPSFGQSWPPELQITPEKYNYERTSTYADVMSFLDAATRISKDIRVVSMGKSLEGKSIPLAILAKPMVATAAEARASGKLIVYIQGNIHAGEVEGKEVAMMQIRRMITSPNNPLLDNLIILFAPIYNTDSNDKMAYGRRPSQENSPPEVGIRENSQGLDLNRDGVKMEAMETNGLFEVINEWDPQLFVDLHTTNGTWHAWNLTWAPSYHYAGEKGPYDFTMKMLRDISSVVGNKYGVSFGPYGDYDLREGWPVKNFYTYNHHPRYLVNQFGLRNRMAILSEAFAHEKFDKRIQSTDAFVTEILAYASAHSAEIRSVNASAEQATIAAAGGRKGVRFKMVPSEVLNDFPTYDYIIVAGDDGKPRMQRQSTRVTLDNITYYGGFEAEVTSAVPSGYIIPKSETAVVENLRKHGVRVEEIRKRTSYSGEVFTINRYELAQRKFEGHLMARATGVWKEAKRKVRKGDFVVSTAQPLGNLAFYLLEPESDDGYVTWNFFDESIEKQKRDNKPLEYPVFKYYNNQ